MPEKFELTDQKFKTTLMKMPSVLMDNIDSIQEQLRRVS